MSERTAREVIAEAAHAFDCQDESAGFFGLEADAILAALRDDGWTLMRTGEVTPDMLAAAWRAFRGDRPGKLHSPGPAFKEAILAALAAAPRQDAPDAAREERS